jgi:hypothetical protein
VQQALRAWFGRWGLPEQLRVDNGAPWGSWGDLPPELALWVIGLGVAMVWNRPRHSQDNAVIERAHGVCQRWVEPTACADSAELQARLHWATTLQRERYPAVTGQSRLAAFPALAQGGAPYDRRHEAAQGDVRRVWRFLATQQWRRRVDKVGRISLYNRAVPVGRAWAGTTVVVQFVARAGAPTWVIRADDGTRIAMPPAPELRRSRIRRLTVVHRRRRSPRGGKPPVRSGGQPYSR